MPEQFLQPIIIIVGLFTSVLMVISGLTTHRRKLFTFNATISLLSVAQFALLGTWSALAISFIAVVRNTMLAGFEHKYPQINTLKVAVLFSGVYILAFTLITSFPVNPTPWYEFFPLVGSLLGTFSSFFKNMIYMKTFIIFSGINWVAFEIIQGAYGQLVGESLKVIANIAAIIYLVNQHKKLGVDISDDEIEDLSTHVIDVITTPIKISKTFTEPVTQYTNVTTRPIETT